MTHPLNRADAQGFPQLSAAELGRYSRHLLLPEVGLVGQQKLKKARVLLVGLGGLGCPVALYLTAAGVGTLGLVDFDNVDGSNLQRQILYGDADVGKSKVLSAANRLSATNPHIQLHTHPERLSANNALDLFRQYDLVVDGTDNFPTRYLVNDACVLTDRPNIHASIFRFEGQLSIFSTPTGPCYRCLFPEPPPPQFVPSCAEAGVLGVLPGLLGLLQANEVVKWILGIGRPAVGRLLLIDALDLRFREMVLQKDPGCPVCSPAAKLKELSDETWVCLPASRTQRLPAEEAANVETTGRPMTQLQTISPEELKRRMDAGEALYIVDVRNPDEHALCRLDGAKLVPLPELPNRFAELDPNREIIVHCRMGGRAGQAIAFLQQKGFKNLKNLEGGILAWAERIDPTMPRI